MYVSIIKYVRMPVHSRTQKYAHAYIRSGTEKFLVLGQNKIGVHQLINTSSNIFLTYTLTAVVLRFSEYC